jgi:hypothetical protein
MEKEVSLEDVYRKLVSIELFMKKFEHLAEDLEFANRTNEALARVESGDYDSVDSENLSDNMMKW